MYQRDKHTFNAQLVHVFSFIGNSDERTTTNARLLSTITLMKALISGQFFRPHFIDCISRLLRPLCDLLILAKPTMMTANFRRNNCCAKFECWSLTRQPPILYLYVFY